MLSVCFAGKNDFVAFEASDEECENEAVLLYDGNSRFVLRPVLRRVVAKRELKEGQKKKKKLFG
jgi:hypothetical protein